MQPKLTVRTGKLYSAAPCGRQVHAAAFLRTRRIVMDSELAQAPGEFARILVHELFHFCWVRLGNPKRAAWADLLSRELARRARGELGWSAECLKAKCSGRNWPRYQSESFCDTAAFVYFPEHQHGEITLSKSNQNQRVSWFSDMFGHGPIAV